MENLLLSDLLRQRNSGNAKPTLPVETIQLEHGRNDSILEQISDANDNGNCDKDSNCESVDLEPYISMKLIRLGIFGVQVGAFCRVHHYYCKQSSIRSSMRKSWLSSFGWWTAFTMVSIQWVFMSGQLLRFTFGPESSQVSDDVKVLPMFGSVFEGLAMVFLMAFRYNGDELPGYWNQTLTFFERYIQRFGKPATRRRKLLELQVSEVYTEWFIGSIAAIAIFFSTFAVAMPQMKSFFSCLSEDPRDFYHVPLRIFSVLIISYDVYVYAAGAYVYGTGFATFLPYVALMNNFRIVGISKKFDREQLLLTYWELQLLYDKLNRSCSTLIFPAVQHILLVCTIFGMYGAIRFEGWLMYCLAATGVICGNILFVVFWTLARVQLVNKRLLTAWKSNTVLSPRDLRTLRPIKMMVGQYGFVDQGLLLTMVDIIASNLITLLLTS